MTKRILDVGQCAPDHATLTAFLTDHFECQIVQCHGPEDTMTELARQPYDLVLINRKLDRDYSDGIEIIKQIKSSPAEFAAVPVMLVTNYADHQDAAVAAGAERGFGKLEYDDPATLGRLRAVLGEQ